MQRCKNCLQKAAFSCWLVLTNWNHTTRRRHTHTHITLDGACYWCKMCLPKAALSRWLVLLGRRGFTWHSTKPMPYSLCRWEVHTWGWDFYIDFTYFSIMVPNGTRVFANMLQGSLWYVSLVKKCTRELGVEWVRRSKHWWHRVCARPVLWKLSWHARWLAFVGKCCRVLPCSHLVRYLVRYLVHFG